MTPDSVLKTSARRAEVSAFSAPGDVQDTTGKAEAPTAELAAELSIATQNPQSCGRSISNKEGNDTPKVSPSDGGDLGDKTTSSFIKKEVIKGGTHRDIKRDTSLGDDLVEEPSTLNAQHTASIGKLSISARIMVYADGRSDGFTLSQLWDEASKSGHLWDTRQDTLKRTLNRMAGKELAKIGKGKRALFCKAEYADALRAQHKAMQAVSVAACEPGIVTPAKHRFPRVQDLLMKKPQMKPEPLSFSWGQGLEHLIRLTTGSVAIIGGSTDAGKTALAFDFVLRNMDHHKIRYINWEMGNDELYERLLLLEKHYNVSAETFYEKVEFLDWYCDAVDPTSVEGLIHYIDPDKVNIVDYLTANENFFNIGGALERIHNKLRKGVCLVALQKDPNAELPYGRGHTQKVARLALTLDPAPAKGPYCSHMRFTKAKGGVNPLIKPTQVDIFFDIQEGAKLTLREASYLGKKYTSLKHLCSQKNRGEG